MTAQIVDVISLFRRGKEAEKKMNEPSTRENQDADWCQAQVYIGLEFLSGKLDFVRDAVPGAYECLENVWLQDVIQLKAYQNWQKRGAPEKSTSEEAKSDYYDACRFFRDRLDNQELKGMYDKDDGDAVCDYLRHRYFETDKRELSKWATEMLIAQKAHRYWRAREKKRMTKIGRMRKYSCASFMETL